MLTFFRFDIKSSIESNYKATWILTSAKTPNYDSVVDSLNLVSYDIVSLKAAASERKKFGQKSLDVGMI